MKSLGLMRRLNPGIAVPVLLLTILGLCFVYSTTVTGTASKFFIRQLAWTFIGAGVFIFFLRIRYKNFLAYAGLLYACVIMLLVVVLLAGKSRGISQSWLSLGPFTLQPSEFAKLAIVLVLARYLGSRSEGMGSWRLIGSSLAMVALPVGLVLAQPDLGTAIVFGPIVLVMMWVGGAKGKHILLLLLAGSLLLPVAFMHLKEYQRDRLLVFVNPDRDPLGAGYNIIQSKIAIGSGGFAGKGIGKGTQNRLKFLPERHTDFIFSIIGEEFGWWGGMLVLLLFSIMLVSALRIAKRTSDMQGKLLVIGLATLIFGHAMINIAVSLGVMPATGLPLPFVSYGGSSLVTCMAAAALISNVGTRHHLFL